MSIVYQNDSDNSIVYYPPIDAGIASLAQHAPNGWVVWQQVGKNKVPYGGNNHKVTTTAKDGALMTYAQAASMAQRFSRFGGLGLYMRAPVVGIDLDDVVTWHDGQPVYSHDANVIMAMLPTYTELSPSGTGLHLYLRYDGDHTALPNTRHYMLPHGGKIAIYRGTNDGYLTVTGRSIFNIYDILDVPNLDAVAIYTTPAVLTTTTPEPDIERASVAMVTYSPKTTPPPEPATNDAPTPAMVKYDAVPRMTAWVAEVWPERVRIACDKMAATPDGMRHPERMAIGTYLGISLRVIELLCDTVGVPRFNIPAPSSVDDVVTKLYDARPPAGSDDEIRSEYDTIKSAVNKAYDGTVGIGDWSKKTPPSLQKILDDASIILPASKPQPATTPAPMATTTPEPATPPAMVAQHPPQTTPTPAPVARAEMVIDFGDIVTPHDAAINALTDDIRQRGVSVDMLFSTAADVMATADNMPLPIIASTKDTAHLLMPGVCSLSAPSKIGKSTMALHLAYAVATGGNVFGSERYKARQGTAVYFDLENYTPLTGTRMAQMYDTPPPLYRHVSSEKWHTVLGIATRQRVDRWQVMQWYVTRTLREWPDTRLLILDNVIQFQPKPARYETPRDVEERYLLWLAGVSVMHPDLCIMLIDHNTKMQSTDKADKDHQHDKQQGTFIKRALLTAGTISISKAPSSVDVPAGALTVSTSPRACASLDIIVKLDATHGHHVLLDVKPLQMSKQQRQIYETICSGTTNNKAISEALGLNISVVNTQIERMRAKALIYKTSHGTYLPSEKTHQHPPQTTPTQGNIDTYEVEPF
jgi:DNA-binding CsgD family transcriptional regulator